MRNLGCEETERGGQVDAAAGQIHHRQHRLTDVRQDVVHRLGVRVVVEHGAVLVPSQATARDHLRHVRVRVGPGTLRVDEARGDVQAGTAGLADVALVNQAIPPHRLA